MQQKDLKAFINQLFMFLKIAQIHDPTNQAFQGPLEQFREQIDVIVGEEGQARLETVETSLFVNEQKVRTDIATFGTFRYLQSLLEAKDIGGILFKDLPSLEDLIGFAQLFVRAQSLSQIGADELNQQLIDQGVNSIELLERVEKKTVHAQEATSTVTKKKGALKNYVKAIDLVRNSASKIQVSENFDSRKVKRVVYNLVDICLDEGFSFIGLSNIKNYDEYTYNHSVNVCVLSIGFGKNLGLTKRQVGELGIAALFHDYGKLAIPREILNKPGQFNPEEWEIMKSHPLQSVKTLLSARGFQDTDIKKMIAAFEHHRNFDCTGYPQTGLNKPMNFYSKVVAIADAYDAMTTNRVYQKALLPTAALKILMDYAGTRFDPLLVKAFVNTVGIYPVGTLLKLQSGRLAMVTTTNRDPAKLALPKIRILTDEKGQKLDSSDEIDLSNQDHLPEKILIEKVVRADEYNINVAHYLFQDVADIMKEIDAKNPSNPS